jgi:hypothetical protein
MTRESERARGRSWQGAPVPHALCACVVGLPRRAAPRTDPGHVAPVQPVVVVLPRAHKDRPLRFRRKETQSGIPCHQNMPLLHGIPNWVFDMLSVQ